MGGNQIMCEWIEDDHCGALSLDVTACSPNIFLNYQACPPR